MKLLLFGTLCIVTSTWAEPQEIASSLTLEQVVDAALLGNAQLRAARAKWEAAQERPVQERTLPNPMLSVKSGNAVDDFNFPETQETRVEVEQSFPWFGKLGLKGKVATKDAEVAQREYEAAALDVIMAAKEAYFDLSAVQRALSITRSEEDVVKRMETIAEAKYGTGEVSQQDVLKAQAEITMLRQRLLELEQRESTLKTKLNFLMNQPADSPLGLPVTAPPTEVDADAAKLFALAEKARPEIKGAQAEIARSEYERDLMKKEFFPDYRLGVEYGHMDSGFADFSNSENVLMVTVGIDLPIWRSKYRAGVREAERKIEASEAALQAAQQQTSFEIQDASFKLLTAQRTLNLYTKELIPQAEMRFHASEAGYRTGKVNFIDLLESERFLLNARIMAAMAEGNVGMQMARLERAVGTGVPNTEVKK